MPQGESRHQKANMKSPLTYPIEYYLLAGLLITVPLLEAPKNILWLIFALVWLINRFRSKDFGGPWDQWDTLITIWLVSGYAIAPFAGLPGSEWGGANDILRYGSILWLIKRSGYSRGELYRLLCTMLIATMIALGYGLWSLYVSHTEKALELHSVGHVNHSAIYLAITFGAALSLTLSYWERFTWPLRLTAGATTSLLALSIFLSASRAAVAMIFVFALILGVLWLRRSRLPLLILIAASVALGTIAYVNQVEVVRKQDGNIKAGNVLAYRDIIWNTALVAWKKYPLFGVGMHNYNQISVDKIKQWVEESGKPFVASEYGGIAHAHSLYLNTLAERGLAGSAVLLAVLVSWLYWLIRHYPRRGADDLDWALWGASLSAWVMTTGIGLANTTLHHEHAILAVSLLGLWLASLRSHITSPDA